MTAIEKVKKYFLVNISLIVILGIVMVYSASYIYSKENFGTSTYFFFKQLTYLLLGVSFAFGISKTKMSFWYKNIYWFNGIMIFMLFLTLTPLGLSIKGSQRWLSFGLFNFQPGEFVKYTVCLASIFYFNNFSIYTTKQKLQNSLHFLIPLVLLLLQPDFGTFSITAILVLFSCFLSDFPRKYFIALLFSGIAAGGSLLFAAPYRVKRLLVFLDPWSDPQNSGFQIIQSYLAFANGHIFGQGIGNSNEKLFYLPEAHNDFIFSVIGEELGFLGVCLVVVLFSSFTFLGFKLALTPKSKINQQIMSCLIFSISLQAFLNMGVVLGLLPTKGLNLPFISYGGSSLFANMVAIGIIISCMKIKSQISDPLDKNSTPPFTQSALGI
ncbi:MAG: putative lipid II flippase FtsW [Bacteriovoracaceae bacterium]|jgi:cell division protein FtsW|nr:putative lipid II flippase FtsW [Bacteriovoracaceae bacterium]